MRLKAVRVVACVLTMMLVLTTPSAGAAPADAVAPAGCHRWPITVVASGLGALENLEPDGRGGFYLSGINAGRLLHVDDRGNSTTVLVGALDHPAGLRISGNDLYFVTGNNPGTVRGTLQRMDLLTGETTTLLTGLPSPNGLLILPNGDLIFSQLTFPPRGIGRYSPATGRHVATWSQTPFPNGLALAPDRTATYTENSLFSTILRVR